MLVILLGHGGDLGKSIPFTEHKYLETPVFKTPFCFCEPCWSDVWNFPFCPFICSLKCCILDIIFLSAVFTMIGLPEFLDKSCFTHKSKIIKGCKWDAVARWVLWLGIGWSGCTEPEDFADISGTLLLSNSLRGWRWQRGCLPCRPPASPRSACPGASHSHVGSPLGCHVPWELGGHRKPPGLQLWWGLEL